MAWNDDSWKDGYDEWKLRSPYDDYEDEDDLCDHEEYESDIITGRAFCCRCDHTWYQTSEEINREIERQAAYQEDMDRENRRDWWRYLWLRTCNRIRSFFPRRHVVANDDDIPF